MTALVQHGIDLWSTEYTLPWQLGLVPIPVRTTVIRLGGSDLIVHSPGPITPALRDEIAALGRVAFLVIPEAHGKYAADAAAAYPSAQLLAAPRLSRKRRALAVHGSLADEPPIAWSGFVESHLVAGFRLNEVVLFHPPSRTLVITDLCFHIQRSDFPYARFFFRMNGMWRRFGPSRILRALAVSDRKALERSVQRILSWDFERIVPGHGDVIERGGREALRAAWPSAESAALLSAQGAAEAP